MKILFLHPDLGIGGAERLIVDCALTCKELNHNVHIITNHHDPNHCFEGSNTKLKDLDYIFLDQVSAPIFLLKLFSKFYTSKPDFKIIFYCHHPDLLLTDRKSIYKKFYRKPLDWFEEWTTGLADLILVNSKYTGEIFRKTFKNLTNKSISILYPICNFQSLDEDCSIHIDEFNLIIKNDFKKKGEFVFLSINRYERKKQINLAIEAFSSLKYELESNEQTRKQKIKLIIAGGYDNRVLENIEYFNELNKLANDLDLLNDVLFLRSPPDFIKNLLFDYCDCVLYTPENEHFGIVPIEAMYKCKPVIACNSGGPLETIEDGETGFLCNSNVKAFKNAMYELVKKPNLAKEMGLNGHDYVLKKFSKSSFKTTLQNILSNNLTNDNVLKTD